MKEIIVTIKKDGTTEIEGKGFVGNACDKAMEPIEKALGKVAKKKLKSEYYTNVRIDENIKIK
jgi:fatty acid/phospholipid biosynthesis enzyme